jgi:hypothetical protein
MLSKHIYTKMKPPGDFTMPNGITKAEIDTYASEVEEKLLLASQNTPKQYKKTMVFDKRYAPQNTSTFFDKPDAPKKFSELLNIKAKEKPKKLFENFWGDEGFEDFKADFKINYR